MVAFRTGIEFIPCESNNLGTTASNIGELCGVNDLIFNYVIPGQNPEGGIEKTAIPLPFLLLTIVIFILSYMVSSFFVFSFSKVIQGIKDSSR